MTSREYPIEFRAGTMKMMPLAASNPATRYDLCYHDTTNAAVASTIAARLSTGVGPTFSTTATFPTAFIRTKASVAAASSTGNTNFEVIVLNVRLHLS